jgi:diphthamide synthase (EF-2-diphthine--ammonia ligase)
VCAKAISDSIDGIAFGDLFLEDVLAYRLRQMKGTGLESIFPLWGLPTRALAEEMVTSGLRAKLTCVDTRKLDPEFAGRDFDLSFLSALPREVDPCGENGEFHSFVYAGPMLNSSLLVSTGQTVIRDGFSSVDLIPGAGEPLANRPGTRNAHKKILANTGEALKNFKG